MDTSSLNADEQISNLGGVEEDVLNIQIQSSSLPRQRESEKVLKTTADVANEVVR